MRLTIIVAIAALLVPLALAAHPAVATGMSTQATELSAAKRKKKVSKPKEEYLKAAPGTGPSGPPSGGKSKY